MKKTLLLTLAPLLLSACSQMNQITETVYGEKGLIKDHSYDYKKSYSVHSLKIPKNLQTAPIDDYYQVPPITHKGLKKQAVKTEPPGSLIAKKKQKEQAAEAQSLQSSQTVIYGSSDQYKLLLTYAHPRAQAWQDIQQALHNGGYKIMQQNERQGVFHILHAPHQVSNIMGSQMKPFQVRILDGGRISFIVVMDNAGQQADYPVIKGVLRDLHNHLLVLNGAG